MTGIWTALGAAVWMAASAPAFQAGVHEYPGASNRDGFGQAVLALDDLDGDGWDDVAVGATSRDPYGWNGGSVTILSARTGATLRTWHGARSQQRLGEELCRLGDLDGDGFDEIAASAVGDDSFGFEAGAALVLSPRTGRLVHLIAGENPGDQCGYGLACMDDVDGDQIVELAVGSWLADANGPDAGEVRIFSGASGQELHRMAGASAGEGFGRSIACLGDRDGNLSIELAVGAPLFNFVGAAECGAIRLCSTNSGMPWGNLPGLRPHGRMGMALARLRDCDGDGEAELAGSAPGGNHPGEVWIWNPDSGSVLQHWTGADSGEQFGAALAAGGDVDLDGVEDLLVGAPQALRDGLRGGALRVVSCANGSLLAQYFGLRSLGSFGVAAAVYPDLDGNGVPECLVGAPSQFAGNRPGSVFLLLAWEPRDLEVSDLRAGRPAAASVAGLPPGSEMRLFVSLAGWGWDRHGPAGNEIDLKRAHLVGVASPSANGIATVTFTVPPGTTGRTIWMQSALAAAQGAPRSNALELTIW